MSTTATSSAPKSSPRPQSRPSSGPKSSAPESSPRPQARPDTAPAKDASTSAPETSPRPAARPTDSVALSREADEDSGEAGDAAARSLLDAYGMGATGGPSDTNRAVAAEAESRVGEPYKPGVDAMCADFVSDVIGSSGASPEGFSPTVRAREFGEMGAEKIGYDDLQPGDVIAFDNTYRNTRFEGDHTHVGVYAGDGQFIHRPTSGSYYEGAEAGEVIKESIEEYLAKPRDGRTATFAIGYRFP